MKNIICSNKITFFHILWKRRKSEHGIQVYTFILLLGPISIVLSRYNSNVNKKIDTIYYWHPSVSETIDFYTMFQYVGRLQRLWPGGLIFTNFFVTTNRLSCKSRAGVKFAIKHVFCVSPSRFTKPVQAPLGVQFKHAWYSRLRQEVLVKDTVLPGDAQYRPIKPVH